MNNDFNNVFDELTPLSKSNTYARQDCDLLYNPEKGKHGKFEVSKALFRRLNLNDHGFHVLTGNGEAYIGIVPNENAIVYAGRPDADNKTREFAATELRDSLNDEGMEGNKFWFEWAGEKDEVEYYRLTTEELTDSADEAGEEVPVSDEQTNGEVSL